MYISHMIKSGEKAIFNVLITFLPNKPVFYCGSESEVSMQLHQGNAFRHTKKQ